MKIPRVTAAALLAGAAMGVSPAAHADKPADDFLSPQDMGPRLSIMPLIGPGLRTNYDHRYEFNEVEAEISELRTQLIADVVVPYGELSANVDIRLFLLTFGASVGYHNEWHLLQFDPNYDPEAGIYRGRDIARQEERADPSGTQIPIETFDDLTRDARRVKDQQVSIETNEWLYYEGRLGFLWPAQNFIAVSTAGLRHTGRPDMSYDWANATVMSGGFHLRWETYAFFRDPAVGFLGPALRVMNVPRHRIRGSVEAENPDGETVTTATSDAACRPDLVDDFDDVSCREVRETELHYGFIGGVVTNWVTTSDVFLARVYTTYGLDNDVFGTHIFGMPLQLLFAYQMDFEL